MSIYKRQMDGFKKALVLHALASTGWNHLRAARELGVQPSYLYRLRHKLGIGLGKSTGDQR